MTTSSSQIIQPLASKTLTTVSHPPRVRSLVTFDTGGALWYHFTVYPRYPHPPFNSFVAPLNAAAASVGFGRSPSR